MEIVYLTSQQLDLVTASGRPSSHQTPTRQPWWVSACGSAALTTASAATMLLLVMVLRSMLGSSRRLRAKTRMAQRFTFLTGLCPNRVTEVVTILAQPAAKSSHKLDLL